MDLMRKTKALTGNSVLLAIITILFTVMMLMGCKNPISPPGQEHEKPVISNLIRTPSSVTPANTVTVSATVTTAAPSIITSVVLQWTLNGTAQGNITMTASGNVYSAVIPAQALNAVVAYKVSATNSLGETAVSEAHSYTVVSTAVDYTKLKLNEVSGVGTDSEKFYELINTGAANIPLEDCKIYYNANSAPGGTLPTGKGNLTWTGSAAQIAQAGELFSLIGRNTEGSFTTGLTAARILIITLEDPAGNVIDRCVRAADTGDYAITDKSFSRIPDGTGDFYFTIPTPNATNGTSTADLTKVPVDPPVISNLIRTPSSVTPANTVTVSATVTTAAPSTITGVVLQWTLNSTAQGNINMTASGNVYSAVIPAQALNAVVAYKVSATNSLGETAVSEAHSYTVVSTAVDYTKLKLNEVSGVGTDSEKFYELINTGAANILLEGCKIYYNANGSTGGTLPTGKGNLTWTGSAAQIAQAGELFSLIGRNTEGSFTTGLTAARILIITLEDPAGNVIDQCVRAADTGEYAITDKSFSRIPDGTGDFYFTTPTPNATNGTSTAGLTKVPVVTPPSPPVISELGRNPASVTPTDTVTVSATVTTAASSTISTVVLQWTLNGTAQSNIPMMPDGNVYSATISAQAANANVTYKVSATNSLGGTALSEMQSYTVVSAAVDYTKLVLNEVSGNNKFVEIYNSGTVAIPLQGVKLQRNDGPTGGSEWVGTASDSIPAGAYRLFLFNSFTAGLDTNPAYTGWTVSSGISSGQILKVAIVDPAGNPVSVFIRGENPLPAWQNTTGVTQDSANTYSRMSDGTWAYAAPTAGAVNGAKVSDIVNPGYLTAQPVDPPVISSFGKSPSSVTPTDTVTVSATVTKTKPETTITTVVLQWTLNGTAQSNINMTASGNVYSAEIPAQATGASVTYKVTATNSLGETATTASQSYTVANAPIVPIDYTKLVLNEVSGNNKFVEIYNSGTVAIPMQGVKLQRNDGPSSGSEWVGTATDSIPAGAYRLILFNSPSAGLTTNPAYTGWTVSSGISSGQILKVAIVDPSGNPVSVFIRGDTPPLSWGSTTGVTQDSTNSYSRMSDGTWAYAAPTPGAANGAKAGDIVSPGYLTAQP